MEQKIRELLRKYEIFWTETRMSFFIRNKDFFKSVFDKSKNGRLSILVLGDLIKTLDEDSKNEHLHDIFSSRNLFTKDYDFKGEWNEGYFFTNLFIEIIKILKEHKK